MLDKLAKVGAVAALLLAGQVQAETLRFGTFVPPQSNLGANVWTPWGEKLEEQSDGELKVQYFYGGALGRSPGQQLKLMNDGITDVTFIVPSYTPGDFPDNDVLQLPIVATMDEASLAAQRMVEKGILRGYDDIKVIALHVNPVHHFHLGVDYEGLDSFKGMRLSTSSPIQQDIADTLGAVPVGTIQILEVAESIGRGVVDGAILAWDTMELFRVNETATTHVMAPMGYTPLMVAMNKDRYDGLSDELKAIIDANSGEIFVKETTAAQNANAELIEAQTRAKANHTFVDLTDEQLAEFNELMKPVIDKFINEHERGQELYDAYVAELEAIRSGN